MMDLALRRETIHSSAADYDHCGHLVVSGLNGKDDYYWKSLTDKKEYLIIHLKAVSKIREIRIHGYLGYMPESVIVSYSSTKDYDNAYSVFENNIERIDEKECITLKFSVAIEAIWVKIEMSDTYNGAIKLNEVNLLGDYVEEQAPRKTSWKEEDKESGTQSLEGGNWKIMRGPEVLDSPEVISTVDYDDSSWVDAVVPGTALISWLNNGLITNPDISDHTFQLSDSYFLTDYWYRSTITIPEEHKCDRVLLKIEASNWKTDVFVNGVFSGHIDGAFKRGNFDITDKVRYGESNAIAILTHKNDYPGETKVHKLRKCGRNGGILGADNPTIHASIGWDWVNTVRGRNVGLYGQVSLQYVKEVVIEDPWITTHIKGRTALLTAKGVLRNLTDTPKTVSIACKLDENWPIIKKESIVLEPLESKEMDFGSIEVLEPNYWMPNDYGNQHMYEAIFVLVNSEDMQVQSEKKFKYAVREFTYTTDSGLTIFCNGTKIICRGGNWGLSDDNLYVPYNEYDTKIKMHKELHLNMIRNWVGMTISDTFYDLCDKYGILVWDEFWLANPVDGPEPNDNKMFIENVFDKVRKVRNHACVVLYCGRNEGMPPVLLDKAMKRITDEEDGTRIYISHSSIGLVSGFGPYGTMPPAWYFENTPHTLHSERGQLNIPCYDTMMKMLTKEHSWPIDEVWAHHDFSIENSNQHAEWTLHRMDNGYKPSESLEEFVKTAQMVCYESHKAMFEAVRTNKSNGLIMWMSQSAELSTAFQTYDDCYDINGGSEGVKIANQPVSAIWDSYHDKIVFSNLSRSALNCVRVVLKVFGLHGNPIYTSERTFDSPGGSNMTLWDMSKIATKSTHFIKLYVFSEKGNLISTNAYWKNPKNLLDSRALCLMSPSEFKCEAKAVESTDEYRIIEIEMSEFTEPAVLSHLSLRDRFNERVLPVYWSSNYDITMPGETLKVTAKIPLWVKNSADHLTIDGWNISKKEIKFS